MINGIELINFRSIEQALFRPQPGINLICGDNATGKTSLLEALWFASSGKSFRTKQLNELIHDPDWQQSFRVDRHKLSTAASIHQPSSPQRKVDFCRVNISLSETSFEQILSVFRQAKKNHYWLANNEQKNAIKHARQLPLLLITPESSTLLSGSPQQRRNNLNWGCFYAFSWYPQGYSRYQRALRQRNACLKQPVKVAQLEHWDELITAELITLSEAQLNYINRLQPLYQQLASQMLPQLHAKALRLYYHDSIDKKMQPRNQQDWLEAMRKQRPQDLRECSTSLGIHRADVQFFYQQQSLYQRLSQGQRKILASAYQLAQGLLLRQHFGIITTLLIDDFSSELDAQHRQRFLECLKQLDYQQCFISSIEPELLADQQDFIIDLARYR